MSTGHVYQAPSCDGRSKQQAPPSDCVSRYVVTRRLKGTRVDYIQVRGCGLT